MKRPTVVKRLNSAIADGLVEATADGYVTADDWRTRRWRPALTSKLDKTLLLPKVWLRWQVNYLKGAPVILAIALYYAWSVGFSVFWDL